MSRLLARLLVFVASASVLVIEVLAIRLLAPYLGVSLEVFTGVIAVILAGISLGAFAGGRLADRTDATRLVGPILVGGGISALLAPLIIDALGPSLSPGAGSILVAGLLSFFAPAATLSALPPVVVKIQLSTLARTGTVVGAYSAIGTAGAIFGTLTTGFVLIAAFPTRPIVMVLGILLVAAGIPLWGMRSWRKTTITLAVVVGLVTTLLVIDGPCQYETPYHCVVVESDPNRESGRILLLDRLPNSYVDLDDPTFLGFRYIRLIADMIDSEMPDGPITMISIGGGGFTLPGYVEATRPGSNNVVLEIDPTLVEIGRSHLSLGQEAEVIAADARVSLGSAPAADVVIGDAYTGASVPWHLTTVEYTRLIAEVLKPGGIYAMNVIDYQALEFARSASATLSEVFAHVAVLAPPQYFSGASGGNFVLVASDQPLDLSSIRDRVMSRGGTEVAVTEETLDDWIDGADVLRDDFAPVDQILGRP